MNKTVQKSHRLHVVDALRGFAIISIMLLHNIEHFDFYYLPEKLPEFIKYIDKGIWEAMFFLFGGKSFAIFALLFGLTFYIQNHNQKKRGKSFAGRFVWRMILLFIFGIINSAFFEGDILTIYAVIAILLVPIHKLSTKWLLIIAVLLLIQPLYIYEFIQALLNPNVTLNNPASWAYFGRMEEYVTSPSLYDLMKGNLTNGKIAVLLWSHENGRYFQILALFIIGYIMGKRKLFYWTHENKIFWVRTLKISAVSFIFLYGIQIFLPDLIINKVIRRPFSTIWTSWSNLSFMMILVSGFVILFHKSYFHSALNKLSPIGKMSLSNYIFQSVIGSAIYYGYGLGLYKYTGATYCLIIGIALAILSWFLCTVWNKYNKQGPLEYIWHQLTWIKFKSNP